jgi:cysteinyl-tRNA synthetase
MISEISGKHRFSELENINYDGYEIDIHTGGEDHIDIHHKNEIIQSEALGFNLSKTWVHNKFVLVDNKKMSKSLGNVYLVSGKYEDTGFYSFQNPPIHEFSKELKEQIIKKYLELKLISKKEEMDWDKFSFDPLAYRLMLFEHHYSQQLNFTWEKLWQSQMRLWGMRKEAAKIESFIYSDKIDRFEGKDVSENKNIWIRLLINNLNFAEFIEKYNQFVTDKVNQTQVEKSIFYEEIDLVADFDKHLLRLQLFFSYKDISEIINLGTKRQKAKLEKNYQKADEIRTEIQKLGWQIDDHAWGWGVWWRGC